MKTCLREPCNHWIASTPKRLLRMGMGYGKHAELQMEVRHGVAGTLHVLAGALQSGKCRAKKNIKANCTMRVERMKRNNSNRECRSASTPTCAREPFSHYDRVNSNTGMGYDKHAETANARHHHRVGQHTCRLAGRKRNDSKREYQGNGKWATASMRKLQMSLDEQRLGRLGITHQDHSH